MNLTPFPDRQHHGAVEDRPEATQRGAQPAQRDACAVRAARIVVGHQPGQVALVVAQAGLDDLPQGLADVHARVQFGVAVTGRAR